MGFNNEFPDVNWRDSIGEAQFGYRDDLLLPLPTVVIATSSASPPDPIDLAAAHLYPNSSRGRLKETVVRVFHRVPVFERIALWPVPTALSPSG